MRRGWGIGLVICVGALLGLLAWSGVGAQPANDALQARWIQAKLNEWRLGLGLGPLATNDTLERLAYDQAAYLASMPNLPRTSFIHNGRQNEGPRERALWPEYGWPDYGFPGQILLSEITWVGERQDALDFWHESRVHRESATNPWYREVGVAAVPYKRNGISGHIFVAVLGARPNVLSVLGDPKNGRLYLSNETYRGARGDTIRNIQQVRLFDNDGRPLTNGWLSWQAELPLPEAAGDGITVLFSDGERQTVGHASLVPGAVVLPGYEGEWRNQPAVFGLGQPTPAPTLTPTPLPPPRIRLVYDRYGLTLMNIVPSTPADVRRLRILGDNGNVIVSDLTSGFVRGSLRQFPALSCLVYGLNSPRRELPEDCRFSSVTFAQPRDLFWTRGDFTVYRDGTLLATCKMDEGVCEFDLP